VCGGSSVRCSCPCWSPSAPLAGLSAPPLSSHWLTAWPQQHSDSPPKLRKHTHTHTHTQHNTTTTRTQTKHTNTHTTHTPPHTHTNPHTRKHTHPYQYNNHSS